MFMQVIFSPKSSYNDCFEGHIKEVSYEPESYFGRTDILLEHNGTYTHIVKRGIPNEQSEYLRKISKLVPDPFKIYCTNSIDYGGRITTTIDSIVVAR